MNIIEILPIELLKMIYMYDSNFAYCNKFTLKLVTKKIYSYKLTNEQINIITNLYPNISNLTLFNCKLITKIGIKYINRLSNLIVLDLSHSNITDWRLRELTQLNNLQILNLTFCFRLSQPALFNCLIISGVMQTLRSKGFVSFGTPILIMNFYLPSKVFNYFKCKIYKFSGLLWHLSIQISFFKTTCLLKFI